MSATNKGSLSVILLHLMQQLTLAQKSDTATDERLSPSRDSSQVSYTMKVQIWLITSHSGWDSNNVTPDGAAFSSDKGLRQQRQQKGQQRQQQGHGGAAAAAAAAGAAASAASAAAAAAAAEEQQCRTVNV